MYHRYMPMENGQYRRRVVQESPRKPEPAPQKPRQEPPKPAPQPPQSPSVKSPGCPTEQKKPCAEKRLKLPFPDRLLPNMDSGDLLLVLVLLLLIAEGNADSEPMILTLLICLLL